MLLETTRPFFDRGVAGAFEYVAAREALVKEFEAKTTSYSGGVPAGYAASRAMPVTTRRTTEHHGGAGQRTLWHPPPRVSMRHHNMWVDL